MTDRIYRPILKRAWRISWRYPWLLTFGVFAAVLGNGGALNVVMNNFSRISAQGDFFADLSHFFTAGVAGDFFDNIANIVSNFNIWLLLVTFAVTAVIAVVGWLVVVSQGALVYATNSFQTTRPTTSENAWKRGIEHFWPLLGVILLGKAVLWGGVVALSILFFVLYVTGSSELWQSFWLLFLFFLLVPFAWILAVVVRYAIMLVILEKHGALEAFAAGWRLFVRHWLTSVEMVALLFVCNVAMVMALLLIMVGVGLPFFLFAYLFYTVGSPLWFWTATSALLLAEFAVIVFVGAWFAVFQNSAWVLLFEKLQDGRLLPKLVRLAARSWKFRV